MRVTRGRLNPRRQMKKTQAGLRKQFYKIHQIHQRLQRRRPSVCVGAPHVVGFFFPACINLFTSSYFFWNAYRSRSVVATAKLFCIFFAIGRLCCDHRLRPPFLLFSSAVLSVAVGAFLFFKDALLFVVIVSSSASDSSDDELLSFSSSVESPPSVSCSDRPLHPLFDSLSRLPPGFFLLNVQ
jgi:hypothetical protein